jgi:hypothetical protein
MLPEKHVMYLKLLRMVHGLYDKSCVVRTLIFLWILRLYYIGESRKGHRKIKVRTAHERKHVILMMVFRQSQKNTITPACIDPVYCVRSENAFVLTNSKNILTKSKAHIDYKDINVIYISFGKNLSKIIFLEEENSG